MAPAAKTWMFTVRLRGVVTPFSEPVAIIVIGWVPVGVVPLVVSVSNEDCPAPMVPIE